MFKKMRDSSRKRGRSDLNPKNQHRENACGGARSWKSKEWVDVENVAVARFAGSNLMCIRKTVRTANGFASARHHRVNMQLEDGDDDDSFEAKSCNQNFFTAGA
jgi:hypothetical protein